ncbi:MAG: HAD hydrolase-like protein [Gemmataceae bacterium]
MPLTLEQYADYLDTRDLPWPMAPAPQPAKAKPHVAAMPGIRAVSWDLYGTLLCIASGELLFTHPTKFVMETALEKTVQEFKMWGSMTRKPGQPSEYMGQIYDKVLTEQKMAPSPGEKYPEIQADKIWEAIVKKLLQKEYKFDAGFFGSLNEYSRKIAYFFQASLQGTRANDGAVRALEHVHSCGLVQGLIADAQCFSLTQLQRGLKAHGGTRSVDEWFPADVRALSFEQRGRKPSERLFKHFLAGAARRGVQPSEVLHIGPRMDKDIVPAKRLGMRTALFAGDKESVQATREQVKDPATRPDALLTDLTQVVDMIMPTG